MQGKVWTTIIYKFVLAIARKLEITNLFLATGLCFFDVLREYRKIGGMKWVKHYPEAMKNYYPLVGKIYRSKFRNNC